MNILFIHNSQILPDVSSGIIRVTAVLGALFQNKGHVCYNAYYNDCSVKTSPFFKESLHLSIQTQKDVLSSFIEENKIDIVISQIIPSKKSPQLLQALHYCKQHINSSLKIISCLHNCPYLDVKGYDWEYISFFLAQNRLSILYRIKKLLWGILCMYFNEWAKRIISKRYQKVIDFSDKFIVLSKKDIPVIEKYQKTKNGQVVAISNPYTTTTQIDRFDNIEKEKLIVFVGRLEEDQKRVSSCLKIWKEIEKDESLNDWKFEIIGGGCDEDYYKSLVSRMSLNRVSFMGVQNPNLYYKRASILLLTSAFEGFGLVLLEAQQMGTIPIAYDSFSAIHDIIKNEENGILVPYNDIHAFVTKLKDLMNDEIKRTKMQEKCISVENAFTLDCIYNQWDKVLQNPN